MQAVILAAGSSTRTFPLTTRTPKALYELAGHAIIEHNLRSLVGIVDEAIIVIGFMGERIQRHLGASYRGIHLKYVWQREQLGTAHALSCAAGEVCGDSLILVGDDLFTNENFLDMLEYDYSVLATRVDDPSRFGVFSVEGDRVIGVVEKPKVFVSDLANTGCYKVKQDFFEMLDKIELSERGEYELTDAIGELASAGKLHWVESNGGWYPIGYPWHLLEANTRLLQARPLGSFNVKSRMISDVHRCVTVNILKDSWVGRGALIADRVMVSHNCYIHAGARVLNRSSVGPNTQINHGSQVDNCCIGANVTIGRGCLLTGCVIGDGVTIGDGVVAINQLPPGEVVTSTIKGREIEVDVAAFSAAIGPGAYIAPLTVLLPGAKIAADGCTKLREVVDGDRGVIWQGIETTIQ